MKSLNILSISVFAFILINLVQSGCIGDTSSSQPATTTIQIDISGAAQAVYIDVTRGDYNRVVTHQRKPGQKTTTTTPKVADGILTTFYYNDQMYPYAL